MNNPENLEFAILTKKYGETIAVDSINLKIPAGTYCCFLGPSGCGKTSTLRMIAGHEEISGGDILLGSSIINDLPPETWKKKEIYSHRKQFRQINSQKEFEFRKIKKNKKTI